MDKPVIGKSAYRKWIFPVLAVLLLAAAFTIRQRKKQETEYSVLPKTTEEPENAGFMRYYLESVGPVLLLEDQDGGMYCFYYGFDQYISERTYEENRMLFPAGQ